MNKPDPTDEEALRQAVADLQRDAMNLKAIVFIAAVIVLLVLAIACGLPIEE
jgi:hypothetical protein